MNAGGVVVLEELYRGPVAAFLLQHRDGRWHLWPRWRRARPRPVDRRAWPALFIEDALTQAALFIERPRDQLRAELCTTCLRGDAAFVCR